MLYRLCVRVHAISIRDASREEASACFQDTNEDRKAVQAASKRA